MLRRYPIQVQVDGHGEAELSITGGIGYVPISFLGVRSAADCRLSQEVDGTWRPVDQSVHGRDFWQTDYDPVERDYRITYNLPLDSPSDRPRTIRLRFTSTGRG